MNKRIQDQAISEEIDQKMEQSANSNDLNENTMMDNPHASLYQQNFITHIIKQPTNEQLSILNTSSINSTKSQQDSQISEKQLREKLILMFKKDKQKNYQICDYFMKDLGLAEHFENVKRFIEFIQRNQQDNLSKENDFNGNQSTNNQLERQFTQVKSSNIPTPNLSIFSTKSTFIASTFSRDKVHILLQLHSTNHKIINFLNILLVSLRSYIFTNQKQWILMKDQIQRYLSKYEKNVQKIYEVDVQLQQQDVENSDLNEGKKLPLSMTKAQAKLQKTKQIKKISSQLRKKYTKRFTLQNYKSQTNKVRQKLTQHQQSMCSALRKSCYSIYERFEHIVEELKDEMLFVIALLQKAQRFNQSKEKYLIKQFLLESRRIGVQGLIYLQLVYKNIIEKIETTRRNILYQIQQSLNNKKSLTQITVNNKLQQHNNNNRDYHSKSKKQLAFVSQVSVIFHKLQKTLMVSRNVNIVNKQVQSNNKIRRSSLLFNQREVVVEVDGDDDDQGIDASSIKSQSHSSVQKIKQFQVLGQKEIKKGEQKVNHQIKSLILKQKQQPIQDLPSPPQSVIEQSQNQKFISAIFGDRKCSQQIKKVQQQKQKQIQKEETKKKDALLDEKKKKRIRKVNKVAKDEDWKKVQRKPVVKKIFQSDSKRVKKETKHKKTGLRNSAINSHHYPQTLSPIVSQDEPNKSQSSSSLQYLSHALINRQTTFTSPKKSTTKLEQVNKNSANYSSMKKSNHQNHYQQFQSLSIDIPLYIQYESGQINMEDFDQVSQKMSSFYNDDIQDVSKDCGGKRE